MAQDLARAGIELPSLMTAGRWKTPVMPAHYIRNEVAAGARSPNTAVIVTDLWDNPRAR